MKRKSTINIKHPGALHKYLGLKPGTEIPTTVLNDLTRADKPDHVRKMANFALAAKGFKHP